ncbi:MAG: NAD(P)/FAD-dependent oxidoreductase [Holosporales bacterium]|nr:NAD(P)/FAD-dependent oxidoreductase [Holosporales bacterium]
MVRGVENEVEIGVAVIGAGVAGLYATYCCGISGLECVLIDALVFTGGQCTALYPEKKIYGVPGFNDVLAKGFVESLSGQCTTFAKKLLLGKKVESISVTEDDSFVIRLCDVSSKQQSHVNAKHIIVATGIGDMIPSIPRAVLENNSNDNPPDFIQHCCIRVDFYKGKNIVVSGGGDSAIDFVINVAPLAKSVTLLHRRDKFTCEESKLKDLDNLHKNGKLQLLLEHSVSGIEKGNVITVDKNSKKIVLCADHLVFCHGFLTSCGSVFGLQEQGLKMEGGLVEVDINTMKTSLKNCYAIGDVVLYPNKKRNIVSCFFEADRAVRMIKNEIASRLS